MSCFEIGAIYLQTITLLLDYDIKWPAETETTFKIAQAAGGDAIELFGCLLSYTNRWITMMIAPFGTLAVFMIGYAILLRCYWKRCGHWSENGRESSSHARLVIVRSWLGIITFLYGPLCHHSFIIFPHRNWDVDSKGFIYDGNIQRGSELHRFMLGMSVGGVFLYGIGIPLLLIVMTSRRCWRGATWQQRQSATGSLLECYKEKYW
jgi:hypothetical protein